MTLSSHQKRLITGLVALVPLLAGIILGGWVQFVAVVLACILGLWEFLAMFISSNRIPAKILAIALGLAILTAHVLYGVTWGLMSLMTAFWVFNLIFLVSPKDRTRPEGYPENTLFAAGLLYVVLPLAFAATFNGMTLVLVLCASISTDTGAFYAGSMIGGKKIWPAVSPKKTWAGSLGGMVACALVVMILGLIFSDTAWWAWLALGAVLNVAAQLGDFFESAIKRSRSVKDSGTLLPGHGGILDRIDSLLLVIPAYVVAHGLITNLTLTRGFQQILAPLGT